MATFTFDTHRAIQNLKEAGIAEAQAEAVVALVSSVFSDNVATKADIQQLEKRLEQKLEYEVRLLRSDMQAMDQRTEARFDAFEQRIDDKFAAFEQRTDAKFAAMEQRIVLKLVAILLPCFGLLFAALRFIP